MGSNEEYLNDLLSALNQQEADGDVSMETNPVNDPDEVDSFENGPYEKKEFVYKDDIDSRGEPVIDMTQPDEVVPNHKTVPEVLCIYISVYNFLL